MGKGQVGMGMERVRTGKGLVRDQTGRDGELNNKKSTKTKSTEATVLFKINVCIYQKI